MVILVHLVSLALLDLLVQLVQRDHEDHKDFLDIQAKRVIGAILDHPDCLDNRVRSMKQPHWATEVYQGHVVHLDCLVHLVRKENVEGQVYRVNPVHWVYQDHQGRWDYVALLASKDERANKDR